MKGIALDASHVFQITFFVLIRYSSLFFSVISEVKLGTIWRYQEEKGWPRVLTRRKFVQITRFVASSLSFATCFPTVSRGKCNRVRRTRRTLLLRKGIKRSYKPQAISNRLWIKTHEKNYNDQRSCRMNHPFHSISAALWVRHIFFCIGSKSFAYLHC